MDGVVIINAVGSILAVNKAAYEMWGYDKGELEGKNVTSLMWASCCWVGGGAGAIAPVGIRVSAFCLAQAPVVCEWNLACDWKLAKPAYSTGLGKHAPWDECSMGRCCGCPTSLRLTCVPPTQQPHVCPRPQPFSSRHNGYLSRYKSTGEARILNSRRAVIGLTKNRGMFPANLTVVKISGNGQVKAG